MSGIRVCATTCWGCKFGDHTTEWHPWADQEDVDWAAQTRQPNPAGQQCGCACQKDTPAPRLRAPEPDSEGGAS